MGLLHALTITIYMCKYSDLAILSKLNATINTCNTQMTSYLFGAVTSALHSFFLYDVSIIIDKYIYLLHIIASSCIYVIGI